MSRNYNKNHLKTTNLRGNLGPIFGDALDFERFNWFCLEISKPQKQVVIIRFPLKVSLEFLVGTPIFNDELRPKRGFNDHEITRSQKRMKTRIHVLTCGWLIARGYAVQYTGDYHNPWVGYGSIPINTIFRGMNIHLPAILMFTRGTRFWHTASWESLLTKQYFIE